MFQSLDFILVCSLFNDAFFSDSDYIASNEGVIHSRSYPRFRFEGLRISTENRIACLRAEI
jgi:hypothetical protein